MADFEQEKTEQATPKKRADAQKKGRVARSGDFVAAASLFGATALIASSVGGDVDVASEMVRSSLSEPFVLETDVATLGADATRAVLFAFFRLATLFCVVVATSVAANLLQTGFLFTPNQIGFRFSRLSPIKNLGRLFSFESLGQTLFGLFKVAILATVVVCAVRKELGTIVATPNGSLWEIAAYFGSFVKNFAFLLCGTLLAIGVLDYVVERFKFERSIKMTREEVREEQKEESGDPRVKGRLRAMRRSALSPVAEVEKTKPPTPVDRYREKLREADSKEATKKKG